MVKKKRGGGGGGEGGILIDHSPDRLILKLSNFV